MKKTIIQILILLTVLAGLVACGGDKDATSSVQDLVAGDKEFTITATNFEFKSDKELIVKQGDKVTLHLDVKEGAHGLSVSGYKTRGEYGESITFDATEVGEFEITCSIPCGSGHTDMKINMVVVE